MRPNTSCRVSHGLTVGRREEEIKASALFWPLCCLGRWFIRRPRGAMWLGGCPCRGRRGYPFGAGRFIILCRRDSKSCQ
ncbi:hypothetical protein XELAEV_18002397mg [Xenopus laevis]|uniref:Uncharacterized protein n=1 Tax=Xenopus laevis TaxID=8355 RepID=A0A974BP42_XENLA|nr:hypothetical protein XELAEV_18002397mg [Xenopus laevis]